MIFIQQLKIPVTGYAPEVLEHKVTKLLRLKPQEIRSISIQRRSVDARRGKEPSYVFSLLVETDKSKKEESLLIKRIGKDTVSIYEGHTYAIGKINKKPSLSPVVIGAGPAGLFCTYALALAGLSPVLLERGKPVEERRVDVETFWKTKVLDPSSNVQFGEGGAGAFSDGKLNTLVKDKTGRNRFVLESFVRFGADGDILYDYKPHIGTDVLFHVLQNMRNELLSLGAQIHFSSQVTDFIIADDRLVGLEIDHERIISCEKAVLCIGHSARDTFFKLHEKKIPMTGKEFAVGFRVEHPQTLIDHVQYGQWDHILHPAPYKLATKLENGRGVYSFCMCPGGYVVNASSEEGRLCVNGMSYRNRDSQNANSAIVVSVGREEFDLSDPLSAIAYQRGLEEKAFALGKGSIPQQLLGDFKSKRISSSYGRFSSVYKGSAVFADLNGIFDETFRTSFLEGMELFHHKLPGFSDEEAILSGVESRTSSPVRILRSDHMESNIRGIYPCGEGAGYAGGITSAAMDGLKVAEEIINSYIG